MKDRRGGRRRLALSAGLSLLIHAALLMVLPGEAVPPGASSKPMTIMALESGKATKQGLTGPGPVKETAAPERLSPPSGDSKADPPPQKPVAAEAETAPPVTAVPDHPAIPAKEESRPRTSEAQPAHNLIGTAPDGPAPPGPDLSGGAESIPAASEPAEEGGSSLSGANRPRGFAPIRYLEPEYPEEARRSGIEGTVEVVLTIGRRGRVDSAELILTSGSDLLDNEVLRTVRLWRFAREHEGALSVHRIVFQLEK